MRGPSGAGLVAEVFLRSTVHIPLRKTTRRKKLAIAEEVAAGRASLAGRDQFLIRAVGFHDKDLAALVALSRRLENKALSIRRPVSLGILAAMRELPNVGETLRTGAERQRAKPQNPEQFHLTTEAGNVPVPSAQAGTQVLD